MRARAVPALAFVAAACALGVAGSSTGLRGKLHAAYRAYRDPSLLVPPPVAPPPPIDCRRFAEDSRVLDAQLAREFDHPTEENLDDPDGPTLGRLALPELHIPVTRRTMRFVRFFARSDAGRAAFLQRYRRASRYRETIERALREAGLPEELVWVPAVESSFDPRASSPAGAAGLWQLMPDTGGMYGLDQSLWHDERRSIARATTAAVAHLRDLYERLGRWDLALAAYNAGYGRITGAMETVAKARGPARLGDKPIGFAELAAARAIPEETANYVPQVLAFAIVAANRAHFELDRSDLAPPLELGELAVPAGTRLRTVARAAGISLELVREYNPQLLRDRVPPTGGDYLVALPADRVPQAIASLPAYLDNEVLALNEEGDGVRSTMTPQGDPNDDDPLPRRPVALGENRLPAFARGGGELGRQGNAPTLAVLALTAGAGRALLGAKLPAASIGLGVGWQKPGVDDPLGVFLEPTGRGATLDAALRKQLGFLQDAPSDPTHTVTLPSGVTLRIRKDAGAPLTSISVRLTVSEDARAGREALASEALQTLTVDRNDVEAGLELAATRLRLSLNGAHAQVTEIRRHACEGRRRALAKAPYGLAWLALSDALFPAGHPLEGTVVGARADAGALRELLLADALEREHARAKGTIALVGDVDEDRAARIANAFLGSLAAPSQSAVPPHAREDRLQVEDDVPSPRALYGWIGPGEGDAGDAALRVALELLENPKVGYLRRTLLAGDAGVAAMAEAALESGARASVLAIEVAPAPGHELAEVEARLEAELATLAGEGPTEEEVALGKALLRARLQIELATAKAAPAGGLVHSASPAKLRGTLRPGRVEALVAGVEPVNAAAVSAAIRRTLGREHRVVVTTVVGARRDADARRDPAAISPK